MGAEPKISHTYKVADAKAKLSELLSRAEAGEEIIIARGNAPIAKLVPVHEHKRPTPGRLKSLIGPEAAKTLAKAALEPTSDQEMRILAGEATDDVGIWVGLPEDREDAK